MTSKAITAAWDAYEAAQARHINVLNLFSATLEAMLEKRPFSRLSHRPYDPFRDHGSEPYAPVRRPYCSLCENKGIVETCDRKEFYCDCEAGREREEMDDKEVLDA